MRYKAVLEYKFSLDGLISDFENEDKQERDINLVAAWEIGTEWKRRYNVVSLLDVDNVSKRPCHGITHVFYHQATGAQCFHAVILSELVKYLNDPQAVQSFHKREYCD